MTGKFIIFEGVDGVGKSTQVSRTREWLESKGIKTIQTREPGGTQIGEQIRSLMFAPENNICAETQLYLFYACRKQLLNEVIKPALQQDIWVLCDRYVYSTHVYQNHNQNISEVDRQLIKYNIAADISKAPFDLVIWLDAEYQVCNTRLAAKKESSLSEREFKNIRDGYRLVFDSSDIVCTINAAQSAEDVSKMIKLSIEHHFLEQ